MTRLSWKLKAALRWLSTHRVFIAELIVIAIISIALAAMGTCSIARQEQSFKGANAAIVHGSDPNGSTLVTFTRAGIIEGRAFPDRETATAFAEAIQ